MKVMKTQGRGEGQDCGAQRIVLCFVTEVLSNEAHSGPCKCFSLDSTYYMPGTVLKDRRVAVTKTET